jgi:hypothetical protein
MKDLAGFQLSHLESRMRIRLDADQSLSPAYRDTVMKMLHYTIQEIEKEEKSIQRIKLEKKP